MVICKRKYFIAETNVSLPETIQHFGCILDICYLKYFGHDFMEFGSFGKLKMHQGIKPLSINRYCAKNIRRQDLAQKCFVQAML